MSSGEPRARRSRFTDPSPQGNRERSPHRKWDESSEHPKCLHITGVPSRWSWKELKSLLVDQVGEVRHVEVFEEGDGQKVGFVKFYSETSLNIAATHMRSFPVPGGKLFVNIIEGGTTDIDIDRIFDRQRPMSQRRIDVVLNKNWEQTQHQSEDVQDNAYLQVTGLPDDWTWRDLKQLFIDKIGDVRHVNIYEEEIGRVGYISFTNDKALDQASFKMRSFPVANGKIYVKKIDDRANRRMPKESFDKGRPNFNNSNAPPVENNIRHNTYGLSTNFLDSLKIPLPLHNRIFIMNLDFNVTEDKIKEIFSMAGVILNVRMHTTDDGTSKGNCFVEYEHPIEAVQAISMFDQQTLYGRPMSVQVDRKIHKKVFGLPVGLGGVGRGLGNNGIPMRHVYFHMNKKMEEEEAKQKAYNEERAYNEEQAYYNDEREMTDRIEEMKVLTAQQNALMNMPAVWSGNQMPMNMPIQNMSMPVQTLNIPNQAMSIPNPAMNMANQAMVVPNVQTVSAGMGMPMNSMGVNMQGNAYNPIIPSSTMVTPMSMENQPVAQNSSANIVGGDSSNLSGMSAQTLLSLMNMQNEMQQQGITLADLPKMFAALKGNAEGSNMNKNSYDNRDYDNKSERRQAAAAPEPDREYRNPQEERQQRPMSDLVCVNNLPPGMQLRTLQEKFSEIGPVKFVDMTGPHSAVVRFVSDWDADSAIKTYNGTRVNGYNIEVRYF